MTDTEDESSAVDPRPNDAGLLSEIVRTAATVAKEILQAFSNAASGGRSQGDDGAENGDPSDGAADDA